MIVRQCFSKQQINDHFMWEARELKKVVDLLNSNDLVWSDSFVLKAMKELDYISNVFSSADFDYTVHAVLRTRIQYLMFIMFQIVRRAEAEEAQNFSHLSIGKLFEISSVLEDLSHSEKQQRHLFEKSKTLNKKTEKSYFTRDKEETDGEKQLKLLSADRTGWCEMCYTSLTMLIVSMLRKTPSCRSVIKVTLSECITLCGTSDNWQRQYMCLGLILASMVQEVIVQIDEETERRGRMTESNKSQKADNDYANIGSPSRKIKTVMTENGGNNNNYISKPNSSEGGHNTDVNSSGMGTNISSKQHRSQSAVDITTANNSNINSSRRQHTERNSGGGKSIKSMFNSSLSTQQIVESNNSTNNNKDNSDNKNSSSNSSKMTSVSSKLIKKGSKLLMTQKTTSDEVINNSNKSTKLSTVDTNIATTNASKSGKVFNNNNSTTTSATTCSSRGRSTLRLLSIIDEMCKSGFLRTVIWMFMHSQEIVRHLAAEVIQLLITRSLSDDLLLSGDYSVSTSQTAGTAAGVMVVSDLWSCCIEQGLISQLEYITAGVSISKCKSTTNTNTQQDNSKNRVESVTAEGINNVHNEQNSYLFPETKLRNIAQNLLNTIALKLERHESLRNRLLTSMLHSGNQKLKMNIFSGLLYLTGRGSSEHALGRLLWNASRDTSTSMFSSNSLNSHNNKSINGINAVIGSGDGVGGSVFTELFTTLARDHSDLRVFLKVLIHFLSTALLLSGSGSGVSGVSDGNTGEGASTASVQHTETVNTDMLTGINSTDNTNSTNTSAVSSSRYLTLLEPVVLIAEGDRVTRMVCPMLNVITKYSNSLNEVIKEALKLQVNQVTRTLNTNNDDVLDSKAIASTITTTLDNTWFVTLVGSYAVWQEIFSHMADRYILVASCNNMSVTDLVEALHIANMYGMKVLLKQYGEVLGKRLAGHTFLQIFQSGVGITQSIGGGGVSNDSRIVDDSTTLHLHLQLCCDCLIYLEKHINGVLTLRKPLDTVEIIKCLTRVVYCVMNC